MASKYRAQVLTLELCGDIATLRVSRPEGFAFAPGQWVRLGVQTPGGPAERTLSLASAPRDQWLEVTTRLSESGFKQAFARLTGGDEVTVSGPGGRVRLDPHAATMAFLVGGVGITPARSYLRDAVQAGHAFEDAVVFYGNRDPECVAYAQELDSMRGSGVRVIDVYEHAPEQWPGARGLIDAPLVRANLPADDGRTFFVAGPPLMVTAMEKVLDEVGVEQSRRIVERFGPVTSGIG